MNQSPFHTGFFHAITSSMKNPRKLIVSTLTAIAFGIVCAGVIFVAANFDTMTEVPNFDEPIDTSILRPLPKAEIKDTFSKLESECEKLTEQTGIDHRLIKGRYLGSKSYASAVNPNPGISSAEYKMVLSNESGELVVWHTFENTKEDWATFKIQISQALGESVLDYKTDTEETFGICAFSREDKKLQGDISTIMQLTER